MIYTTANELHEVIKKEQETDEPSKYILFSYGEARTIIPLKTFVPCETGNKDDIFLTVFTYMNEVAHVPLSRLHDETPLIIDFVKSMVFK